MPDFNQLYKTKQGALIYDPLTQTSTLYDTSDLVYVKTNIGGFFFDAVFRSDHTRKNQITTHPVQSGAAITDHVYNMPSELTMEVAMSDTMQDIIDGQFSGGWSRSVTAFKVLEELWRQRLPLQILTRLGLYQNMIIETISVPDDLNTLHGLKATVSFKQIIVVNVQTVKISAKPQTTDSTNKGTIVAKPVDNSSILKQILDLFKGAA